MTSLRAQPLLALIAFLCVSSLNTLAQQKWRKLQLKLNLDKEKGQPKLMIWSREGFYQ